MRRLDRYILTEIAGPFLFGIGAFVVVLMSIDLLRNAFSLIFEKNVPAARVAEAFVLQLPQEIVLTLPMAALFGVIMAVGRLSGEGEVVAMQAGGLSFPRILLPVVLLGVVVSVGTLAANEFVVPSANKAARSLIVTSQGANLAIKHDYSFQLPTQGEVKPVIYAGTFDMLHQTLSTILIVNMRHGEIWEWFKADTAQWVGTDLVLRGVTYSTADGGRTVHVDEYRYPIGAVPSEVARYQRDPSDMNMRELKQEIAVRSTQSPNDPTINKLWMEYHSRISIPWCALGFALLAAPLALRPHRTSTGIGLGISLVVILAYYTLYNLLAVVGTQGVLSPALAAWTPNLVLFLTAIGLVFLRSR